MLPFGFVLVFFLVVFSVFFFFFLLMDSLDDLVSA